MTKYLPTFEIDKEGLAQVMSRNGPGFAIRELVQNAWDEASSTVTITLTPQANDRCLLTVEDDNPSGFANIAHAYTLFAESAKKGDATKRGRFNLGEKLVIAICDTAAIETTTGTIRFGPQGRSHHPATRTSGSMFSGLLRMTKAEYDAACREVHTLIVPPKVTTIFNGVRVLPREPLRRFSATLPTEIADADGQLRRTARRGEIAVYRVQDGEEATIYEMGIPVVATGDRWHVDVGQKVPLNVDRNNVTPAYLQDLRRVVLNECHDLLDGELSGEKWIDDAMEDPDVSPEAVNAALDKRFGEKRVSYDPTDKEANNRATAEGFTVVAARSLSKGAWVNVRAAQAIKPAGQVWPTPRPYTPGDGNERGTLPESDWTPGMHRHAAFARMVCQEILGVDDLEVHIVNDQAARGFGATWTRSSDSSARLEYWLLSLGRKWFDQPPLAREQLSLLIHEMGHQRGGGNHLDRRYLNELTDLAADMVGFAIENRDRLTEKGLVTA